MSKYIYRKNGYDFHVGYDRFEKHVVMEVAKAGTREVLSSTDCDYLDYKDMGDYTNAYTDLIECERIAMRSFDTSFPEWLIRAILEDVKFLKWSADDTAPREHLRALPEYKCYVRVLDGVLYSYPSDIPGVWPSDREAIVTHPESQDFLDAVNTLFDTNFTMEQFFA